MCTRALYIELASMHLPVSAYLWVFKLRSVGDASDDMSGTRGYPHEHEVYVVICSVLCIVSITY